MFLKLFASFLSSFLSVPKQKTLDGIPVDELLLMLEKPKIDTELLQQLLKATFETRRLIIQDVENTMAGILEKWPVFTSENVVCTFTFIPLYTTIITTIILHISN
jgi:hypothetical protein